jgi:hypothetical protein
LLHRLCFTPRDYVIEQKPGQRKSSLLALSDGVALFPHHEAILKRLASKSSHAA